MFWTIIFTTPSNSCHLTCLLTSAASFPLTLSLLNSFVNKFTNSWDDTWPLLSASKAWNTSVISFLVKLMMKRLKWWRETLPSLYIYIYIYVYVCVCVCVCGLYCHDKFRPLLYLSNLFTVKPMKCGDWNEAIVLYMYYLWVITVWITMFSKELY